MFKEDAVLSCEPDVRFCRFAPGDEFFFLACDGLFDVCTSQEAVDFVGKLNDGVEAETVCKLLGEHAIELGSKDNVRRPRRALRGGRRRGTTASQSGARAAGVGTPDNPPSQFEHGVLGGNASSRSSQTGTGLSDSDIKEMEDLMNEAMSSCEGVGRRPPTARTSPRRERKQRVDGPRRRHPCVLDGFEEFRVKSSA